MWLRIRRELVYFGLSGRKVCGETAHMLRYKWWEETSHAPTRGSVPSRGSWKYKDLKSVPVWHPGGRSEKQAGWNVLSKAHGTRHIWQWLANPFTLHSQLLENRARIIFEFASLILSLIYGTWSTNMCWTTKMNKPFPKVIYRTLGIFFIYNRPSVSHLFQYGWSCSILCGPWKKKKDTY